MNKLLIIASLLLLCVVSNAQDNGVHIRVAKPKIKAVDNNYNIGPYIHGSIKRSIANIRDYVDLVDRTDEREIETARKTLKKNTGLAATAMIGANYVLESKISNVRMSYDSVEVIKDEGKSKKWLYRCDVGFDCVVEIVSVESGEAIAQQAMNVVGFAFELLNYKYLVNKDKLLREALIDQRECFETQIQYMVLQLNEVKSPIVSMSKVKKEEAKKVLVKGGRYTPVRPGLKYEVIKTYTQTLGGKEVLRKEKIGELKHDYTYEYYTECKVKKGKKEIYAAINAGEQLYAKTKDLKPQDTCDGFLAAGYRANRNKAYKAARKEHKAPTPTDTKNSKSSKKSKTKRKVKRKSN